MEVSMFKYAGSIITVALFVVCAVPVFANKTSVEIKAPESVKKGTEVTVIISVTHSGNNRFHHTEWVWVRADGKEIARWNYTGSDLPENENFTKEVKVTVNADTIIETEGNCNRHGSNGVAKVIIKAGK
jgi:desulfoferrodoxin (superoxide reductase-like protein)